MEDFHTQVAATKMSVAQEEKCDNTDNYEVAKLQRQVCCSKES